jgi:hypothetical protein
VRLNLEHLSWPWPAPSSAVWVVRTSRYPFLFLPKFHFFRTRLPSWPFPDFVAWLHVSTVRLPSLQVEFGSGSQCAVCGFALCARGRLRSVFVLFAIVAASCYRRGVGARPCFAFDSRRWTTLRLEAGSLYPSTFSAAQSHPKPLTYASQSSHTSAFSLRS